MSTIPATQQDQLSREEKIARAEEAKRLMEHPLMREAFANVKLNYFEAWASCPPEKVHDRDRIFHCVRVVADVEGHLKAVIDGGKVDKQRLDREQARAAGRA